MVRGQTVIRMDPQAHEPPADSASFDARFRSAFQEMLPAMVADGGGAEILAIRGQTVELRLVGMCLICPSRQKSAAALERGLRTRVPDLDALIINYPVMPPPPGGEMVRFS